MIVLLLQGIPNIFKLIEGGDGMSAKKWLLCFILTALLLAAALAGFNLYTDPFGVFGDRALDWYSFDETNNPRAAKLAWLKDHLDDYDSYLVGCSSTSSYPVEALNAAYGAKFYNTFFYGADMLDAEQVAAWLLEHDEVKYIFLNVEIDNGHSYDYESHPLTDSMPPEADGGSKLRFYARFAFASPEYGLAKLRDRKTDTYLSQPFDVFDVQTGAYDKKKRDVEPIGALNAYLDAYPVFRDYPQDHRNLARTNDCMASVRRIRDLCEQAGAELIVAAAPVYRDDLAHFDRAEVVRFYSALAEITDFWDFSCSSVSQEPRYFYDATHFRNCVGEMAVARIAGDASVYVPADFGTYVTASNAADYFASYWDAEAIPENELTAKVPVLMYHHLTDGEQNSATITPALFREHMQALSDAGYQTVSLAELRAYVYEGAGLPDKPVLLTFDDGYESNYELAFPVLKEFGMKAAIFVIGSSVGKDTYKDTGEPIHPHFSAAQAQEMTDSGLIEIQSHTYDMHQSATLEPGVARESVEPLEGETEADFIAAMRDDFGKNRALIADMTGSAPFALAYPKGVYSELTQAVAVEEGIVVTLTSDPGVNTLVRGLPQSLLALRRNGVNEDVSVEQLLALLGE